MQKYIYIMVVIVVIICIASALLLFTGQKETIEVAFVSDSLWDNDNANNLKLMEYAIDLFKEQNPDIKVKYWTGIRKEDYSEWLSQKIINGETPDVFFILPSDLDTFAAQGVLKNLNSQIEKDSEFKVESFYNTALQSAQYEGDLYALPKEVNPMLMFVNVFATEK